MKIGTTGHRRYSEGLVGAVGLALTLLILSWSASGRLWRQPMPTPMSATVSSVLCDQPEPLVLPTDFGGVHRYSIPGEFEAMENGSHPRAGILHIYLKALRWPVGQGAYHLKARGFLAFEFTSVPKGWPRFTFHNVPELATRLHLDLHSTTQGWTREVAVEFQHDLCERVYMEKLLQRRSFNYKRCTAKMSKKIRWMYNLGDIALDFGAAASPDFELEVRDWPRSVSLRAQLQEALVSAPAEEASSPPTFVRALPYLYNMSDVGQVARILEWSHQYHAPLGMPHTLMYLLRKDVAAATAGLAELVHAQHLTLVLWDQFATFKGWRDFDLQIVENHAVLSLWGRNVRVLVADFDEFLVPSTPGDTLPSMLSTGCLSQLPQDTCIAIARSDIHVSKAEGARGSSRPVHDEPSLWSDGQGSHPLTHYHFVSNRKLPPKLLVEPSAVMSPNVHFATVCNGTTSIADGAAVTKLASACGVRVPCSVAQPDCVNIFHVRNMHQQRSVALQGRQLEPRDWLWMLEPAP